MDRKRYQLTLNRILDNQADSVIGHQRSITDQIMLPFDNQFVLFGAGRLGRYVLAALRSIGILPLAFADNNPQLWGTEVDGLKVFSPQQAASEFGSRAVFIVTIYTSAPIHTQLHNLDLQMISFPALTWRFPNTFLPYYGLELPYKIFNQAEKVLNVLNLWADEDSCKEYIGQLEWRISLNASVLPPHLPPHDIYFPSDIIKFIDDEVLVDCGAYIGDTIQVYIQRENHNFRRIIAIEPDPISIHLLQNYVSNLPDFIRCKIVVMQKAIGSKQEKVFFNVTGSVASSTSSEGYELECFPLDYLLSHEQPTYIKMDIEGAEIDALLGGRKTIEQYLPVLAISIYHSQEHLWQIPALIRSFSDRYHLFLRRYSDECWESVCYAIPGERLSYNK